MIDVERFEVPTPFSIGRVNCYLFDDGPVTLIDPGPATDEAYDRVETRLERAGLDVADVERIVVTHPHMDHFGGVRRIAERSGADVLASEHAVEQMADPTGFFRLEQEFFTPFLIAMGVPEDLVDTVVGLPEPYTEFSDPVSVHRELSEGERVDVGVELEVLHTPGHSPGAVCFVAEGDDTAFTGDHVLPRITPNPLLTLEPGVADERTRSLPAYLDSLEKLLAVDVSLGYGGHGDPITTLPARIRETIEHHRTREERIADVIAASEPVTAYEIMRELFPDLPATETFSGMSEVIGHIDLLEDEDRVEISESDGVRRYSIA